MNTNTGNEETRVIHVSKASRQDIAIRSHLDNGKSRSAGEVADRRLLYQESLEQLLGVRQSSSERSISEIMLSRCEELAYSSVKCPHCGGSGVVGPATQKQQDEILARIAEWREVNPGAHHKGEALPRDYGCECSKCNGTGHFAVRETEVTVWPRFAATNIVRTGKLVRIDGDWVFDRELDVDFGESSSGSPTEPVCAIVFAQASRILNAVARQSMLNAVALGAYYGPPGDRWEKPSRYGRLFSLFPLTIAGQKLLHRTRKRAGEDTPWGRIHSLVALPNQDVRAIIKQAYEQSKTLLTSAADMWDAEVKQECAPR